MGGKEWNCDGRPDGNDAGPPAADLLHLLRPGHHGDGVVRAQRGDGAMNKYDEHMERALMAEFVPFDSLFGAIVKPQAVIPMRPDDELIPGRDDLEESA